MNLTYDLNYLKHHILLLAITGAFVIAGIWGVESLVAKHDIATEAKYNSLLAAQVQQNASVEAQITAQEAHYQEIEKTLLAQNAQLSKTILDENTAIAKQRQADATLSAQQAAERISQQVKAAPGEVTANGNNVIADLPVARSIASSLDLLVGTQSELADTQTQLKNETTIDANDKSTIGQQTTLIAGLKKQNDDQIVACAAQVSAVKATARKNSLKWFAKGFVTGLVTGIIGKRLLVGKW